MKNITLYTRLFFVVSILCTAVFVIALILQPPNWKAFGSIALATGFINAILFRVVSKNMKATQLIVENQILHIQPAVLRKGDSRETETKVCETVEMFVSCFGILLGSKIIKFNQDGIRLKAVEIGGDYVSIDYGTNMNIWNVRLLYARPDSAALGDIVEKFHYETGIMPTIRE